MRSRLLLGVVGFLVTLVVGAGLGVLMTRPQRPQVLADPGPVGVVPVTWRMFEDRHTVEITITRMQPIAVTVPRDGRLTRWECAPGIELESGASSAAVDGLALLNLATEVPLWRDLRVGDSGADVAALQQALADLGAELRVDGTLGSATLAAYNRAVRSIDPRAEDETVVSAARLLWLPARTVRLASCEASRGELVTGGDRVAEVDGELVGAQVSRAVDGAIAGARVLVLDGTVVPVDADLRVSDAQGLAGLASTSAYRTHVAAPDSVPLTAALVLAEPVRVATVPPNALFGLADGHGCVSTDSQPVPVRVVASELGQTLVTFAAEVPGKVDTAPQAGASCP